MLPFLLQKSSNDIYPESSIKPLIWTSAFIPPAIVAFYRYKAGKHFPTDILAGIPIGAVIGILVPHLHKKKIQDDNKNFSFSGGANKISVVLVF